MGRLAVAFQVATPFGDKIAARDGAALGRLLAALHSQMTGEGVFPVVGAAAIVAHETATVAAGGWR